MAKFCCFVLVERPSFAFSSYPMKQTSIMAKKSNMTIGQLVTSFPAKHDDDSLMSDDNPQSKGGTNAIGTNTLREEDRDEVKEIQKMSQTETRLIRPWARHCPGRW
jgi:hypothetical protein